ncbi:MAG: hypothetical protein A2148_05725 [Chloroflexi bacterium RBG_16_68_14]|nr:MAG: hypothetical protein A2148_05725 [Chloroflexi bacterium RBG_16_68_14]
MEPRIQYAKTSDGVSIAYSEMGEGTPLVEMPVPPWGHLELEWQMPEWRRWYERLAEGRMLVRYDGRGSGLSDRDVTGLPLDAQVLDLEAVVDHLALGRFALLGVIHSGPAAITYAIRHPERVSHLVLWCTYARASDYNASPQAQALEALIDHDWDLYTETVAHARLGWSAGHSARQFAAYMRESTTPEAARAAFAAIREYDVASLLPQVRSPTLVLHRRQLPFPDVGVARGLASRIPDARLALLEGESLAANLGDTEAVATAIDEFLGEGEKAGAGTEATTAGGLVTILFTDLTSSTALTQRLGDAKAQELLRAHNTIVRDALREHGGSEIKHTGDGIMASFPSASNALHCAIAIQKAVEGHSVGAPRPVGAPLQIHIGLNAGEPVAEDQDLFGTAVQLARRICDQAKGGEILASNVVRELAAGKGFLFADRGEAVLRGFEDPVRLYELRWRD